MQDYQGGRDYAALKKFADDNLKPLCSPTNIDLCDDAKKAEIAKFQAMSDDELAAEITKMQEAQQTAEDDFKKLVEGLQKQYQEATAAKETKLAEIKDSGLGLMKAVQAAKKSAAKDEL